MKKLEDAGGTQVGGWNLEATLQDDKEHAETLWRQRTGVRAYVGAESSGDYVKSEAEES
jgi:hypothetical protein